MNEVLSELELNDGVGHDGPLVVITFRGKEIFDDGATLSGFRADLDYLRAQVDEDLLPWLVFDLSGVQEIQLNAMKAFVAFRNFWCGSGGRNMRVCGYDGEVERQFNLSRWRRRFTHMKTLAEAKNRPWRKKQVSSLAKAG